MAKSKKKKRKPGLPPGSLIYTGEREIAIPNVSLIQYNAQEYSEAPVKDKIPDPAAGDFVNWYDVRGLNNVPLIEAFGRKFEIHPLALEDALDSEQRPKFEEYENGLFLILEAISWNPELQTIQKEQVSVFTRTNLVISFQEDEDDLFPAIRERLRKAHGKIRMRGADYLAYALMDYIVDNYYLVLDQMEEVIEELEQEILTNPQPDTKSRIHKLKLSVLRMRKSTGPLREAIGRLYKTDSPYFEEQTALFVRDLQDHISQVTDSIETYRDILNGIHDLYLSEISFKMNNVIQILTIISTIFIPLTFLVGVYGMNFEHMPELEWRYSYYVLWGIMISIFIGLLFYFRRKKWI